MQKVVRFILTAIGGYHRRISPFERDYFHSLASCDHKENSVQNGDATGKFVNVPQAKSTQCALPVYICIRSPLRTEVRKGLGN